VLIINSLESNGAAALHSNLHRKLLFCILTRENYQVSLSIDGDIILNCAPQWLSQLTDIHTWLILNHTASELTALLCLKTLSFTHRLIVALAFPHLLKFISFSVLWARFRPLVSSFLNNWRYCSAKNSDNCCGTICTLSITAITNVANLSQLSLDCFWSRSVFLQVHYRMLL